MEFENTDDLLPGYQSGYLFPASRPQEFNSFPFGTPAMSCPYLASPDTRSSHISAQQGPFLYPSIYSMHDMTSALVEPSAQGEMGDSAFPTGAARFSGLPGHTDGFWSGSHQPSHSSLQQVHRLNIQDRQKSHLQPTDFAMTFDTVALANEMPIGSQVHRMIPPSWGVVKIANIPYSVTRKEIIQFFGRHARLINPQHGCPIHIIMERSTAKTMDCYAEFQSAADAEDAAIRINRIYETGRAPRLGNRSIDVEISCQDALLRDLFPRAKCILWKDGMPFAATNTDPYSTGFTGFFTSEEIIGAIRHAEIPHRSPFCAKCPQRTYESTISTLYKFPWHATELYTVHDRNQLFELANRHILSLVARVKKSNTVGLDQRLLRELLYAGLNCPAFNERQKYTLCINSEDTTEIMKFPDMGKWFPFDTLVKYPKTEENRLLYYVKLISKATHEDHTGVVLPNNFPTSNVHIESPYGRIWFEWPLNIAKSVTWKDAVDHETKILNSLVLSGWIKNDKEINLKSGLIPESSTASSRESQNNTVVSSGSDVSPSRMRAFPTRHARNQTANMPFTGNSDDGWHQALFMHSSNGIQGRFPGHRNTLSSPICLPSTRDICLNK